MLQWSPHHHNRRDQAGESDPFLRYLEEMRRRERKLREKEALKETIRKQIEDLQNKLKGSEISGLGHCEQMKRLNVKLKEEIATLKNHKEFYQGNFNNIFDSNLWTTQERETLVMSIKSFRHRPSFREVVQNDKAARRVAQGLRYIQSEMTSKGMLAQKLLDKLIALRQSPLRFVKDSKAALEKILAKELHKLTYSELMARQKYLTILVDFYPPASDPPGK